MKIVVSVVLLALSFVLTALYSTFLQLLVARIFFDNVYDLESDFFPAYFVVFILSFIAVLFYLQACFKWYVKKLKPHISYQPSLIEFLIDPAYFKKFTVKLDLIIILLLFGPIVLNILLSVLIASIGPEIATP